MIARRIAFVVMPAMLVAGCGIVAPQSQVQSPPTIDRSVLSTNASPAVVGPLITYNVRRGTVRDVLNVPGRVVASRSAQVTFAQAGTISAISVRSGQAVSKDDPLAELRLDADALEAARSRAAAADLTYENQLARIDELQKGSSAQALAAAARAAVVKAQTDLGRAQIGRDALQQDDQAAQQALSAARDAANRQVALAELGVQQAQDELAQAQDELARLQAAPTAAAVGTSPSHSNQAAVVAQAQDQADADVASAAAAQRAAARKLQQASLDLEGAQSKPNEHKASLDVQDAQATLGRADQDLKDAQRETERPDRSKDPTGVIAAAAVDKVRSLVKDYAAAQASLARAQDALQAAGVADQRAVQIAQLAIDQAQDEAAQAGAAAERAARTGQRSIQQAIAGGTQASATPVTAQSINVQDPVVAAQARERAAERQVQSAQLKLQEAQTTQATSQADTATKAKLADLDVQAAQAEVNAAQAGLSDLQQGTAVDTLAREQRRADLLRDDAAAAHQALQPTQQLKAPFDGIIASVDAQLGELADSRTPVARIVAAGAMSVTASASESDVTHLKTGQSVQLTFPGLGDQAADGTIAAVSVAATAPAASDHNQVTYPVQIDLSSAPPELKLGMTANLNLELRQAQDVLYVPKAALRNLDGHSVVSVVNAQGGFGDVLVQVGGTYGTDVEIKSGVNEGDTVAVIAPATGAGTVAMTKAAP